MVLLQDIPEWLPLDGLRNKIQYAKMKKQCNSCFGNHLRKNCSNEKVSWLEYVSKFKTDYPEIPDEFYGKWLEKVGESQQLCPTERDFHIPKDECILNAQ